jgi:hypothetical protein
MRIRTYDIAAELLVGFHAFIGLDLQKNLDSFKSWLQPCTCHADCLQGKLFESCDIANMLI